MTEEEKKNGEVSDEELEKIDGGTYSGSAIQFRTTNGDPALQTGENSGNGPESNVIRVI